jgi:acetyl esterase/lipase
VEDAGGDIDAVRCVVSDDTEGYDLVERAAQGGRVLQLVQNAFGTDPSAYPGASPINHVDDRSQPPDFLVITRGLPRRVAAANAFADAVRTAGAGVDVLEATGLTHADVNRLIGTDGDTVVTPAITEFLDGCMSGR